MKTFSKTGNIFIWNGVVETGSFEFIKQWTLEGKGLSAVVKRIWRMIGRIIKAVPLRADALSCGDFPPFEVRTV